MLFYDALWCSMRFCDVLRLEHSWFPFVGEYLRSFSGHFFTHISLISPFSLGPLVLQVHSMAYFAEEEKTPIASKSISTVFCQHFQAALLKIHWFGNSMGGCHCTSGCVLCFWVTAHLRSAPVWWLSHKRRAQRPTLLKWLFFVKPSWPDPKVGQNRIPVGPW